MIVSEPSNPWIAGVAALFTREFFAAARDRLAPGGVVCQWANAYNIGAEDLQAIVATFLEVFPAGAAWLVGEHDVLLVGGVAGAGAADTDMSQRLEAIAAHWQRPGVAEDLATVAAVEPLSVQSLYVGGRLELARYAAGAPVFADDRITLEFTAPREILRRSGGQNGAALRALVGDDGGPEALVRARRAAGAAGWRHRGQMFARSDVHPRAYEDFLTALALDPDDAAALDGLVRAATLLRRGGDALARLQTVSAGRADTTAHAVARSKLAAAAGEPSAALSAAHAAVALAPADPAALEQLASIQVDAGRLTDLDATIDALRRLAPRAATEYYAAVARLLRDDPDAALDHAERAIAIDPAYAAVYDLAGAALTKLDAPDRARAMFERSLAFDAHDSAAYLNLGLLDLASRTPGLGRQLLRRGPVARSGLGHRARGAGQGDGPVTGGPAGPCTSRDEAPARRPRFDVSSSLAPRDSATRGMEVPAMTRNILLAAGLLAVSTSAFAQANPEVEKALLAAPANAREAATVIKWKADGTYDTLKEGTNTIGVLRPVGPAHRAAVLGAVHQ